MRKIKKSRKRKKQTKLSRILSCSKKKHVIINRFFQEQSSSEIINSIQKVGSNPYFKQIVNLTLTSNFNKCYSPLSFSYDFEKNLSLMAGILLYHSDKINMFIELEGKLTESIVNGHYKESLDMLNNIDILCGVSTWSMAIRGTLYKLSDDHDELQKYLDTLNSNSENNNFIKSIAKSMLEIYNDDSLMFETSNESMMSEIVRVIDGGLKDFLVYKIIPLSCRGNYKINFENLSNFERNSSIIDIFKFIIHFLSNSIDNNDPSHKSLSSFILGKINSKINCYILDGIESQYTGVRIWNILDADYTYVDRYTSGEYEEICSSVEVNSFYVFSTFVIICKAAIRTGDSSLSGLKGFIAENLASIFNKDNEYKKSLSNIFALCHAFSGVPWFKELHYLVLREGRFVDEELYNKLLSLSCIYSRSNYPRKAHILCEQEKLAFLNSCEQSVGPSIALELYRVIFQNDASSFDKVVADKVDPDRAAKFYAKILISNAKYDQGIKVLEKLQQSTDLILANECKYLLSKSYIESGNYETAIQLFAENVIGNGDSIHLFDSATICNAAKSMIGKSSSIFIPISLSLFSRFVSDKFDSALRYCFEMFLTNTGVTYPLELIDKCDVYGKEYVYYYLEHVCTPDKMKLSFIFDTKEEIEKYRIEICNYLIRQDVSKDNMINEAKDLTKEQVIKKAASHVDQSRIYADLSGFKDDNQVYKEIFERFLLLREKDFSKYSDERSLQGVHKTLGDADLLKAAPILHLLDIAYNEKNSTFHRLIKLMRDEFTYGEKGLNRYLSTRIRHGVLSGKLRACASNENLVTAVDPDLGKAKPNSYWLCELSSLSSKQLSKVETALSSFTLDFDSIVNEINDKWLQVTSLDQDLKTLQSGDLKELALFDYTISMIETYHLQQLLTDNDYHNFVRLVSNWLWKRTESNLDKVKLKLCDEAQERFNQCYGMLHDKIVRIDCDQREITHLVDAISRSKELLQPTINSISQWFTVNKADSIAKFDLQTGVEIARRLLNIEAEFKSDKEIVISGRYLNSIVDIFYILFENAYSKSGIPDESLKIHVTAKTDNEDNVQISVNNNCNEVTGVEEKNLELCYYTKSYDDNDIIDKAAHKEGGTGVFKIRKILSKDLEVGYDFNFGYAEQDLFNVLLTINDFSKILYNENTTC